MEWWNEFTRIIEEFWNKPVPIIGFTVGALIVASLWIISKTSIGKKSLNELKRKYKEIEDTANAMKHMSDELIIGYKNEIAELTQEYENKLSLVQANKDEERKVIIAIAENINNVKVKKIIEEYKKLPPVTDINAVFEHKAEQLEKEYESKYELVLKEIEEWKNHQVN